MHAPDRELPPYFAPGALLAGKYRIEMALARGGMSVLLAAFHEGLDVRVAIKILRQAPWLDEGSVARFVREARTLAKLRSDHVVRVLDVGRTDDGAPYIAMELLHGHDLATELQKRGSLDVEEAVDFVLQAIDAIAEAHSLGIVHRDLKPANLFVESRRDGSRVLKVLDFGIAKPLGRADDTSITASDGVLGSPTYMAPEQIRAAKDLDERVDVWALGVVLFELVAGRPPFDGGSAGEVMAAILERDAPPLRSLAGPMPLALEACVARALRRAPQKRFASVAEMARALAPFGSTASRACVERASRLLGDDGRATDGAFARTSPTPSAASTLASPQTRAAWIGVGVLAVAAIGIFAYRSTTRAPTPVNAVAAPSIASAAPSPVTTDPPSAASALPSAQVAARASAATAVASMRGPAAPLRPLPSASAPRAADIFEERQ